jgi:hypothetical protein
MIFSVKKMCYLGLTRLKFKILIIKYLYQIMRELC